MKRKRDEYDAMAEGITCDAGEQVHGGLERAIARALRRTAKREYDLGYGDTQSVYDPPPRKRRPA